MCVFTYGFSRFCSAVCISLLGLTGGAHASEPNRFDAYIVDMSFSAVIDTLRRDLGVQFSGERYERRRVSNLRLNGTPDEVVSEVMKNARMDAFPFNGQIYYAPIEDRAVRLIPLGDKLTADEARRALQSAGLIIPGYDVKEVANGGALVLSGPVQYLAFSEGVLAAILVEPDAVADGVRVRRGGVLVMEGLAPTVEQTNLNP